MQLMSAVAESAHAPLDRTSPEADQHASMAASCLVHGLTGTAAREKGRYKAAQATRKCRNTPWRGLTFSLSICIAPFLQGLDTRECGENRKDNGARLKKKSREKAQCLVGECRD